MRIAVILLLSAAALSAQSDSFRYNGSGYLSFSTGVCKHGYNANGVVGGGEAFVWKRLTAGFEAGVHSFSGESAYGELHVPIGYHFVDRKSFSRWDPFVSGSALGLSYFNGATNSFQVGGGTNYWISQRFGFRMEFRTTLHLRTDTTFQGRFGITFR
jgi:hypothetical protein